MEINTYLAYKANSCSDDEVEGAQIIAQEPFGDGMSVGDAATRHDYNASEVCRFLSHLPQGTLDRVMMKLMETRARLYVVRERDFVKKLQEGINYSHSDEE